MSCTATRHPPRSPSARAPRWAACPRRWRRSNGSRRTPPRRDDGSVKRQEQELVVARNRKARHDYHVEDTWEAGLVLVGTEVKALRAGRASLVDGFAEVEDGEVWLQQVHIPQYAQGTWTNHTVRRKRKL